MINVKTISNVLGVLLLMISGLMLTCLPFSFYFKSGDHSAILKSSGVTFVFGLIFWFFKFDNKNKLTKRDGYIVVTFGWIFMVISSMLPYLFSGSLTNFVDAFFESSSGLTTTGASVINDITKISEGILFWRSLTQWIGGLGIVVLTVALFPLLGIGGVELFVAESPGPTADRIHPRISETAKRLWYVYAGLTLFLTFLFYISGMTFFEAINHALTTMATGGFSTRNESMIHFSPLIQYITTLFMFFAGTNFVLLYFGFKGKFYRIWKSEEFRTYLYLVLFSTALVTITAKIYTGKDLEIMFRESLFMVVSIVTTTGFVSGDYTQWSNGVETFFIILLFSGACAGSTAGGIKIIRHLVFGRNTIHEFKRILHPNSMIRLKIDKAIVAPRILTHILVFLGVYLTIFMIGTLLVTLYDIDLASAASAVATSLGNVGPGVGLVNPMANFSQLPEGVKIILAILMIIGRLEIFSVLILFTPVFWRIN